MNAIKLTTSCIICKPNQIFRQGKIKLCLLQSLNFFKLVFKLYYI